MRNFKGYSKSSFLNRSNLLALSLGNQIYNGTQNYRKPIPVSMRADQQISPASSSSSSSGLLADIDTVSNRHRRESELEVARQKIKEMSSTKTTTTKGRRIDIIDKTLN